MPNNQTQITQILGRKIRERRKSLGLTQQQLGDFAACGLAYIHLLERGKPRIRLDKLLDVLTVLGLEFKLEDGTRGLAFDDGDTGI